MNTTHPWQLEQLPVADYPAGGNPIADVLIGNHMDSPLWHSGQRLHDLFEQVCDRAHRFRSPNSKAIEFDDNQVSFQELDALANQIARLLHINNLQCGERVAILFDRSVFSHASVLAISKAGGAYVPLDAGFPTDRIDYILRDSEVSLVLTLSQFSHLFSHPEVPVIALDSIQQEISAQPKNRIPAELRDPQSDRTCYIIYTSGSTGRPKGVAISHANICSFLAAAVHSYGYLESDRVYQGMTMAFDFSVEELWVPLLSGATLVPAPSGMSLLGDDLAEFLKTKHITAMCCVPTLLATIDSDLPELRFLMVSGEASSQELLDRWCRPERRILNTYGPTEATVTATWSIMKSTDKVTIGGPLPGYSIVVLCPDTANVLPLGQSGELCIGGPGLAQGYVNLPEQTAKAFITDFIGLPDNPSGKIYRTGDLAKINDAGQIEYEGRIDEQVKIRGYRIELTEIENVINQVEGVGPVAVSTFEPTAGNKELIAYYTSLDSSAPVPTATIHKAMTTRLPPYMVPSYIEHLPQMPLLPSTKVNRKALPKPEGKRFQANAQSFTAAQTETEIRLAAQLATLLNIEQISTRANFFDELSANSLILARFSSALRRDGLASLSMQDLYQNPTIAQLANLVDRTAAQEHSAPTAMAGVPDCAAHSSNNRRSPHRASKTSYITTAVLQLAYLTTISFVGAYFFIALLKWVFTASETIGLIARACFASGLYFTVMAALFIAIKWIAIGSYQQKTIPVWSFTYFRFWVARSAIQFNPLSLFVGTPIYNGYLRLLGAKIGRGAVLYCRPPKCPDLLSIGSNTIVRQDSILQCYVARDGYINIGPIDVGNNCLIAETSVLDICTGMGDNSQLGINSALPQGAQIEPGSSYHGTPAQKCDKQFDRIGPLALPPLQPVLYCAILLIMQFAVFPAMAVLLVSNAHLLAPPTEATAVGSMQQASSLGLIGQTVITSFTVFIAGLLLLHVAALVIPRLINLFITTERTHRLYGVQYALTRALTRVSQAKTLNRLYGDSSLITHFLNALGYDMKETTQTGSNFGTSQRHHSPFLNKFSENTLASDGLFLLNMDINAYAFRLSPVTIASNNYLGNSIHWPAGANVGKNCLVATKATVPVDGPLLENTGILGSPPFEIPRSVARDRRFDGEKKGSTLQQNLSRKLRSNLATIAISLTTQWFMLFLYVLLATLLSPSGELLLASTAWQATVLTIIGVVSLFFIPAYIILTCRAYLWLRPMTPLYCSLYDKRFWRYERFWKLNNTEMVNAFAGTPFKNMFSRLQGAKFGACVFDDGSLISEPGLVEVGDHCCFNHQSTIQGHSLEEGAFKSDHIQIGSFVNLDVLSFVHYGTQILDGGALHSNAFLMKGSRIEAAETWIGNPAMASQIPVANTPVVHPTPLAEPQRATVAAFQWHPSHAAREASR